MNKYFCGRIIKIGLAIALMIMTMMGSVVAKQFSLRCFNYGQPYHFTFDTEAKRVIFESLANWPYPGRINAATADRIEFEIKAQRNPKFNLVWNWVDHTVIWIGIPGHKSRKTTVDTCQEIGLRPILPTYDGFGPYDKYFPPDKKSQ